MATPLTSEFKKHEELRHHVATNLHKIDPDLRLYRDAKEYVVDGGKIDILAIDPKGDFVAIEVKLEKVGDAIGQLACYMPAIEECFPGKLCRGIVIAPMIRRFRKRATSKVPGLSFYSFRFTESEGYIFTPE